MIRRQLRERVAAAVELLDSHARHEDAHVQPHIGRELPALAGDLEDHVASTPDRVAD